MYNGGRWLREAPSLDGRHRRRGPVFGGRVGRVVHISFSAGSPLNGRVHVVAEERPGSLDINSEREEGREDDDDACGGVVIAVMAWGDMREILTRATRRPRR